MPSDRGHTKAVGGSDASPAQSCGSPPVRATLPADDSATETDHWLLMSSILMGNHRFSTLGGKDTTSNNHCQFFRITNGPAL